LLEHVLTAVWDVSANAPALMLSRGLVRAANGRLTILTVRDGAGWAQPLVDTWQTLERLVTSSAWDGLSVRVSGRPDHLQRSTSIELPLTLVAVPIDTAGEQSAGRELVEQLCHSIRVPLVVIPDQARAADRVRSVLAVVDNSPASLTVLATAAALAQPVGAHLTVLHTGPRAAERCRPTAPASARHWVDITAERLRAMGISATGRATLGDATDAIESIAESERADVVVLATPTSANGRDLGKTAERLLRAATRPVLLIGRDAHIAGKCTRGTPYP
jgi:hypothetical protein